jgi:hypothetical protein
VGVGDVDVAVGDVADVGGVVEDAVDRVPGPLFVDAVGYAAFVEFGGDGAGAEALAGVEVEDLAQDGRLVGVWGELVAVGLDEVAVGAGAAGPFAFAGFRGHSTFHSVDDDVAFEFGEDGE